MLQFSVKWASVAAVYVGLLAGMVPMLRQTDLSPSTLYAAGVGMFIGGAAALPFAAVNCVAALGAHSLTRGESFPVQFGTFAALSLPLGYAALRLLDRVFAPMGGFSAGHRELLLYGAFWLGSMLMAAVLMLITPASRTA
ncbi:hypothetical protein [Sphingosinithalassobacter sp. CS137]|uniref:hypothetical protein n=1 Tax=Sphingosinithalassobacter sp. CS137 TaxID=2762748 RepID=UPI00165D4181|nr:hypothetical protein [Sphingosinithalassobacter sp. CS137]